MPPALLSREEVVDRLMAVVRRTGYDGASLAELSKATGLGKSSLYHYFPAGKDDMVRAVLDRLQSRLEETLFAPLRRPGPPKRRLEEMVRTLDAFYRGGREGCVLGSLGLGNGRDRFHPELERTFNRWIDAIAAPLQDAGLSRTVARGRAEDAVLRIQGALVLAAGLADPRVFARTLRHLPTELVASA